MEFPKDIGIQGQWIPVNPAKPNNIPLSPNWVHSGDVSGPSGVPWSGRNHGQMPAFGQIGGGSGYGELQSLVFGAEEMNQVPYRRLLEMNDPTILGGINSIPFGNAESSSRNQLNVVPKPQYRTQYSSFLPNLNSLPEFNLESGVVSEAMAFPATAGMTQTQLGHEFINLVGGYESYQDIRQNELGNLCSSNQVSVSEAIAFPTNTRTSQDRLPRQFIDLVGESAMQNELGRFSQPNPREQSFSNHVSVSEAMTFPTTMRTSQNCPPHEFIDLVDETSSYQDIVQIGLGRSPQFVAENPAEKCFSNRVVASEAMSLAAAVERRQDHQSGEIIDLVGGEASHHDYLQNEVGAIPQSVVNNPVEQCFSNHVEPSQIVTSHQHQEGERNVAVNSAEKITVQPAGGDNQGIDLNTPAQKPRRRKYTPKVIREGKPARTPRTPKPPKKTENSSGKRKYVRKKKDDNPQETPINPQDTPVNLQETPSCAPGEIIDQSRRKNVRRSLNFSREDSQAVDRLSESAAVMFRQKVLESQGQDAPIEKGVVSSQTATGAECSQGQRPVVMERAMDCSVGFDLNSSTSQLVSENVRIPQTPSQPPQPSRQEVLKTKWQNDFARMLSDMNPSQQPARRAGKNLKKLARMMNSQKSPPNHERHLKVGQSLAINENSDVRTQGAKRGYNLVNNDQVARNISSIQAITGNNRMGGDYNTSNTDPCSPDIIKRRRVESGEKEVTPNSYSTLLCTSNGWKNLSSRENTNEVATFADAQRLMAFEKSHALKHMLMFNQVEKERNDRQAQDQRLLSSPTKLSGQNNLDCNQPPTPEKEPGCICGPETEIYGPKARVEVLIANQMKPKTQRQKKKKKEEDPRIYSMATNTNQMDHVAAECQIVLPPTPQFSRKRSSKRTADLGTNPSSDGHNSRNSKALGNPGFPRKALVSFNDFVDELVRRLSNLTINGSCEDNIVHPQNALVPYVGAGGAMVPFEGPFDPNRKRKPRPKVDLDPESNRVWNLLMGKPSNEDEEKMNLDKEKWWEEERRIFRGRADSFIARMHLIQGDRRFSRWKGSVVDSVIGVFLTQNVSDHLSSSAFMCLAARFPPLSKATRNTENVVTISRSVSGNEAHRWKGDIHQSSSKIKEPHQMHDKKKAISDESFDSNNGGGVIDCSKESSLDLHEIELGIGRASPDSVLGTAITITSSTSAVESEDGKSQEDVVSSQNSVASSQNFSVCAGQMTEQCRTDPLINFEADELPNGGRGNGFNSFRELLEMAEGRTLNDLRATGCDRMLSAELGSRLNWQEALRMNDGPSVPNVPEYHSGSGLSIYTPNSSLHPEEGDFLGLSRPPSCDNYHNCERSRLVERENADLLLNKSNRSYLSCPGFDLNDTNISETRAMQYDCTGISVNVIDQSRSVIAKFAPDADSSGPMQTNGAQATNSSRIGVRPPQSDRHSCCQNEASSELNVSGVCLSQQDGNRKAELRMEGTLKAVAISNSQNDQSYNLVAEGAGESNSRNELHTPQNVPPETAKNPSPPKKVKTETDKKKTFDWDSLRRQAVQEGGKRERSSDAMDSLDYEALKNADVNEISNTIRERGMNNMLAERIKDFLNRLVRDHGSIDLEWLRDVPPDKTKDYLLSIRGLGLKSVECVRLLTLHHLAFPVDTNVGRIAVRLGWVPLQPLPESLQLHLLEMYPILETIQKYLWPRLCKLDQRTLYELHYQLITFGKVFCTKSKPNCNSCPMRGECKHFASAFASARLALPGPEEKRMVSATTPLSSEGGHVPVPNPVVLPQLEGSTLSQGQTALRYCEPIIEEPASPEPECIEEPDCTGTSELDIEDAFYNDPEEIPTIKLNLEEFTQNLQNYMQENNLGLHDCDMSKALVAITPEFASIPTPKLKNVNRLRTEHQVYELPDSHPLLEGLDKREPDDPCPYLLAIWTPGETAQSIEPPTASCNSQSTGKLCDLNTCFSCNSIRESRAQVVRGTLLIPCRTANRGSFPLNGTYFQVNEVFADHDSSRNPIDVPRDWIWNLPRRTVYFGTSIPSIFKGLTTEGIQHCFWRGFVCVRGFDRTSRAPRPLFARLHFPASKAPKNKTTAGAAATAAARQG